MDDFLADLLEYLTELETSHNFDTGPLGQRARVRLSAYANTARRLGRTDLADLIREALDGDGDSQRVLLFTGIEAGPVSPVSVVSLLDMVRDEAPDVDVLEPEELEDEERRVAVEADSDGSDEILNDWLRRFRIR